MPITQAEKSRRSELRKTLRVGSYVICGAPRGPSHVEREREHKEREAREQRAFVDKYAEL
jgi:hypothetical protein